MGEREIGIETKSMLAFGDSLIYPVSAQGDAAKYGIAQRVVRRQEQRAPSIAVSLREMSGDIVRHIGIHHRRQGPRRADERADTVGIEAQRRGEQPFRFPKSLRAYSAIE